MMDDVAVVVLVHHHARRGRRCQGEMQAPLHPSLRGCMRASITLSVIGVS